MNKLKRRKAVCTLIALLILVMEWGCFIPKRDMGVNTGNYNWSSRGMQTSRPPRKEIVDRAEGEPLTLEESIMIALSNNRRIAIADLDLGIAEDEIREALSVFIPKLRLTAQRLWRDLPRGGRFGPATFTIGDKRINTAAANILVPIFDASALGLYRQSQLRRDVTEYQAKRTRQAIIFDTVSAYFAILDARKLVQLIEKSISTLESQLKVSRDFYEQGLVGKEDVLQAELRRAEREQELISARNSLDLANSTFNRVLGLDIDRKTEIEDVLRPTEFRTPLEDCVRAALEHRLDKKALEKQREIARSSINVTRAERYPKLYGTMNYDYTSDSFTLPDDYTFWTLNVQIDPFKGGEIFAKVQKAKKELEQIEVQLRELDANIELEVKKSCLDVMESRKRIDVSRKAIEHAEENLRIVRDKYQQNLVTLTDVLDAETTRLNAHSNYNRALYDHFVAIAELEKAMGTGIYEVEDERRGSEVEKD